ncbi:MAG: response regulator [Phycisphaerales bacterium]|nr:response regulator [Phycisphaerae bacterium]NNF44342.1 response regulator [Phycisphaerales bacterium]NNM25621.1 response regulator [Phycisphaerales bacterium]
MNTTRRRLLLAPGVLGDDPGSADALIVALSSAFEVRTVESNQEAIRLAAESDDALVILGADTAEAVPATGMIAVLEQIGEGVGVVDRTGRITWANTRLRAYSDAVRQRFVRTCRRGIEQFNQAGCASVPLAERPGRRFSFAADGGDFELLVAIAGVEPDGGRVTDVVGMLWEVTATRKVQRKIDAIDAAGSELMRIDATAIARLNMAERLKILEEKIVRTVRELLAFDHFEIRIIDRDTNQLEPVFSLGIAPLGIGEAILAEKDEHGICGYVAATGESYLCPDIRRDERYTEGLADAVSSLTVPLRLHDRVIGVFNIESRQPAAFDESDRRFAEIFGRYVAMAMHIFDLLVVERFTTNEQIAGDVITELEEPLKAVTERAEAIRRGVDNPAVDVHVTGVLEAVAAIRRRLEAYADGPKSIVGADQEIDDGTVDPVLEGRRVILADNEPTVRQKIGRLLRNRGCDVTICAGGAEMIDVLRGSASEEHPPDLVISDIRMPDRNGYEVFRTCRELFPQTPVILITGFGYDPHHSIVRASQEGLHAFLFKPIKATALLDHVREAIRANGE